MEWKVSKRINHSSTYDSISYLLVINIPNNFGKHTEEVQNKTKNEEQSKASFYIQYCTKGEKV
ncbi:hypothetical protein LINPERPRIM_LOCUS4125 [Linum perenne]